MDPDAGPKLVTPNGLRLLGRWVLAWLVMLCLSVGATDLVQAAVYAVQDRAYDRPAAPMLPSTSAVMIDLVVPLAGSNRSSAKVIATVAESGTVRPSRGALLAGQGLGTSFHWLLDPTRASSIIAPSRANQTLRVVSVTAACEGRWVVALEAQVLGGGIRIELSGVEAPQVRVGQYVVGGQHLGQSTLGPSCSPGIGIKLTLPDSRGLLVARDGHRGGALGEGGLLAAAIFSLPLRRSPADEAPARAPSRLALSLSGPVR